MYYVVPAPPEALPLSTQGPHAIPTLYSLFIALAGPLHFTALLLLLLLSLYSPSQLPSCTCDGLKTRHDWLRG